MASTTRWVPLQPIAYDQIDAMEEFSAATILASQEALFRAATVIGRPSVAGGNSGPSVEAGPAAPEKGAPRASLSAATGAAGSVANVNLPQCRDPRPPAVSRGGRHG